MLSIRQTVLHPTCRRHMAGLTVGRRIMDRSSTVHVFPSNRLFHATSKDEILPILAVGAVALIGRYSWKALNRMDEEWEDYQWALQEYERQRRKDKDDMEIPLTIGVDLGSIYLKLSSMKVGDRADLLPTAQGDRYRFTGILVDPSMGNNGDETNTIMGKQALSKFFYTPEGSTTKSTVSIPFRELQALSEDDGKTLVQRLVIPTVRETLERMTSHNDQNGTSPARVRTILTLPPVFYSQYKENLFQQNYHHDESHQTITVPDPVAAIWGAQSVNLLPMPSSRDEIKSTSTLVIDIGGLVSSISLVREDRILATSCLDNIGGESYVQQLTEKILKEAGDDTIRNDPMILALIQTGARDSILELVQKTSSKVHIPFFFMGRRTTDPHLDMTISRNVMDRSVEDYWTQSVIPKLLHDGQLSSSLPAPTSASALIASAITKVLEESGEIPTNIQHMLLVGGGSRFRFLEQAVDDGIMALMGPSSLKIVKPEASLRSELTTMGAAAMLPNYAYNYDRGLERV